MNIKLDKTEPVKAGDKWKFVVIATVLHDQGQAAKDQEIRFFLGERFCGPKLSNASGVASEEFVVPAGTHLVFARLPNGTFARTEAVIKGAEEAPKVQEKAPVPEEKPKARPFAKPIVARSGDEGGYQISVQLNYDDGTPAPGQKVRCLVSRLGVRSRKDEVVDEITDESGFALFDKLSFNELECDVTIQAGGHQHVINNLYGPHRTKSAGWEDRLCKGIWIAAIVLFFFNWLILGFEMKPLSPVSDLPRRAQDAIYLWHPEWRLSAYAAAHHGFVEWVRTASKIIDGLLFLFVVPFTFWAYSDNIQRRARLWTRPFREEKRRDADSGVVVARNELSLPSWGWAVLRQLFAGGREVGAAAVADILTHGGLKKKKGA